MSLTGIVKEFDVNKGYGYIVAPDTQEAGKMNRYFVHFSAFQDNGVAALNPGTEVRFTHGTGPRGLQASMVYKV
jgi:cold shock CspA family protein